MATRNTNSNGRIKMFHRPPGGSWSPLVDKAVEKGTHPSKWELVQQLTEAARTAHRNTSGGLTNHQVKLKYRHVTLFGKWTGKILIVG